MTCSYLSHTGYCHLDPRPLKCLLCSLGNRTLRTFDSPLPSPDLTMVLPGPTLSWSPDLLFLSCFLSGFVSQVLQFEPTALSRENFSWFVLVALNSWSQAYLTVCYQDFYFFVPTSFSFPSTAFPRRPGKMSWIKSSNTAKHDVQFSEDNWMKTTGTPSDANPLELLRDYLFVKQFRGILSCFWDYPRYNSHVRIKT